MSNWLPKVADKSSGDQVLSLVPRGMVSRDQMYWLLLSRRARSGQLLAIESIEFAHRSLLLATKCWVFGHYGPYFPINNTPTSIYNILSKKKSTCLASGYVRFLQSPRSEKKIFFILKLVEGVDERKKLNWACQLTLFMGMR